MDRNSERTASPQQSEISRRKDHELFHEGTLGRCPGCGRLIMLPCLACAVRESGNDDFGETIHESCQLKLELHDSELERYLRLRAYRDRFGVSRFDDPLFVKRACIEAGMGENVRTQ